MLNIYVEDDAAVKVGPVSELRLAGQSLRTLGEVAAVYRCGYWLVAGHCGSSLIVAGPVCLRGEHGKDASPPSASYQQLFLLHGEIRAGQRREQLLGRYDERAKLWCLMDDGSTWKDFVFSS
jgi:hypothetical protein